MADQDTSEKLFKEGPVKARVMTNRPSKTAGGHPQYEVRLRVEDGVDKDRFITWYGYFGPETSEKQKNFRFNTMRTAGWDGLRPSLEKQWGERDVLITIKTGTMKAKGDYKERQISEVQYINSPDGSRAGVAEMPAAERASVADALFGAYQTPANGAPAPGAEFSDKKSDDIPF